MTDQNQKQKEGQQPWTVTRLLDWTGSHFTKAELDSPRLCAEVLLAAALNCQRLELYTRFDYLPSQPELTGFRDWVRRAAAGEPVAYLIGNKEFYSLPFTVTNDVLIPRPETELVVENAIEYLRGLEGQTAVWDVCTGSGCVAIAVAHNVPGVSVFATDISPGAVAVATENAEANNLASRVVCNEANLLSLPADWAGPDKFDVITANPPYVGDDDEVGFSVDHEPEIALRAGPDGLEIIRELIGQVGDFIKPAGLFCMEFGLGQADSVRDLLVKTDNFHEPTILRDLQDIERTVTAIRK